MIATLQMYDWPEIRDATDAFWHGLSHHLGEAVALSRPADHKAPWRDPALLFAQTCGYPFTHEFAGKLTLLGTPHYEAEGCQGFTYCSFIFARNDAPQIAIINDDDSMSGMLALKLACKQGFAQTLISGGHLASLEALQKGKADICAIDAVCVALASFRDKPCQRTPRATNAPRHSGRFRRSRSGLGPCSFVVEKFLAHHSQ